MNPRSYARYFVKAFELWKIIADDYGWRRSYLENKPMDGVGRPIPWYTYSAIEFLESLNFTGKRIFEYGCGNSSRYWAARAREVHAVENNPDWARIVRSFNVENLHIYEMEVEDDYVNIPRQAGGIFDVVVIDGRFRHKCVGVACQVVAEDGFILFDNADRYPEACADMRARGWKQIDFNGPGPINPYVWRTTLFISNGTNFIHEDRILKAKSD